MDTLPGHSQRRAAAAGGDAGAGGGAGVYGRRGRSQAAYSARPHVYRLVRARRRVSACVFSVLTVCSGRHFCVALGASRAGPARATSRAARPLWAPPSAASRTRASRHSSRPPTTWYSTRPIHSLQSISSSIHKLHKHRFNYSTYINYTNSSFLADFRTLL